MSKPIFIVRFPYDMAKDRDVYREKYKMLDERLSDYNVLCLLDNSVERVEFECFNSQHTDIEFNELRERVLQLITKP